jgi:hypothetical protein
MHFLVQQASGAKIIIALFQLKVNSVCAYINFDPELSIE